MQIANNDAAAERREKKNTRSTLCTSLGRDAEAFLCGRDKEVNLLECLGLNPQHMAC